MHALIVSDGTLPDPAGMDQAWPGWRDGVALVVAADGGARGAATLGIRPDLVVGDGDSLGPDGLATLRLAGVAVETAPTDKDESDTELAVRACLVRGATRITIIGAFGGRLDHAIANVWLLALPSLGDCPAVLLDESSRVSLVRADAGAAPVRRALPGRPGDLVSLFPLGGDVHGIATGSLKYPLRDESLLVGPSRGLSNVRLAADASVTVRSGLLLVVETPATLSS